MERGLFASLTFRLDRWENGAPAGYMDDFNVTELVVTKPDPDVKQRISRKAESSGAALGSVSRPKPDEITFKTDTMSSREMAMAMLGAPIPITQAVAAVNSTGIFKAAHGAWVPLSHVELSAFAIAGKTVGTDYQVHLAAGLVKTLGTGTIVDGADVEYTFAAPARSGHEIYAGTSPLIQVSMLGSGINLDTGKRCGLEIYKANVSPSGGLSFIADDYISAQFKGTLIKPEDKPGPYRWWEFD